MTFFAAHITDIHYPVPSSFRLRDLATKRITGAINLLVSSRRSFRPYLLTSLLAQLKRMKVSHLLITGDLVNLAYSEEYVRVRAHLEKSGFQPHQVSIVPGNHDAYLPVCVQKEIFWEQLGPYAGSAGPQDYPFVHETGPLQIIGLSTALPTAIGMAYGELGISQLKKLEAILSIPADRFRVILIHHSPCPGGDTWHDGLVDGARLRHLMWRYGVNLILHGHEHRDVQRFIDGPHGTRIPVVGTGCAILDDPQPEFRARFRLLRFSGTRLLSSNVFVHDANTDLWTESNPGVRTFTYV